MKGGRAAVLDLLDRHGEGIESSVRGDSMGESMPDGARIRIGAVAATACVLGDVIALSTPAGLVAHRIVARGRWERAREYVITRGDGRVACDPPIHHALIAGRVLARLEPNGWRPLPGARPLPAPKRQLAVVALLVPRLALELHPRLAETVNAPIVLLARLLTRLARIRDRHEAVRRTARPPDSADRTRLLDILSGTAEPEQAIAASALLQCVPGNLRPYLAHRLLERGGDALPPPDRASLHELMRQAALANLRRQSELRRVLARLAEDAVPAIVLKGPVLGPLVYPAPHLRPCRDLDLWVRKSDLERAQRSLATLGLAFPEEEFGGRIDPRAQPKARMPESGTLVELHAPPGSLAGLTAARHDAMWERTINVVSGGLVLRALGPADQLVHIALHAARRDLFVSGLLPLVDLALLVARYSEDWDWHAQLDGWRRVGIEGPVLLALRLARRLLDAPLPGWLLEHGPASLERMEPLAVAQLWEGLPGLFPPGVATFVAPWPVRRRALAVLARLTTYYWTALPGSRPAGLRARARAAVRRLGFDLGVRLPKLIAAAARGELRPRVVRARSNLWRDRERLALLLDADGGATGGGAGTRTVTATRV